MGMYTDDDLEVLVKKSLKLSEENNRLLRKMRRAQVWGVFFKILTVAVMVGVPVIFYFYFVQPYIEELQRSYAEIQDKVDGFNELQLNLPELPEWAQGFFGSNTEEETASTTDTTADSNG